MTFAHRTLATAIVAMATMAPIAIPAAHARSAAEITAQGASSLRHLEAREPKTRFFAHHARAVLVFPSIFKAGLVFGGESGNGVLFIDGRPAGYYNLSGGTWGLQIGAEKFSYALFFMNDSALQYLESSDGWAIGTGPSVVVVDKGAAASLTSTTLSHDVYAVPFGQKGLMAGVEIEGSKITHIHP